MYAVTTVLLVLTFSLSAPAYDVQLLKNPSFEDDGDGFINPPISWTAFNGGGDGTVWANPWGVSLPIYEGMFACGKISDWGTLNTGWYQRVPTIPGGSYTCWAYCRSPHLQPTTNYAFTRIGADPAGGTNQNAAGVQWGQYVQSPDTWTRVEIHVTATTSWMTFFIHGYQPASVTWNGFFFDACGVLGPGPTPTPYNTYTPTLTPTKTYTYLPTSTLGPSYTATPTCTPESNSSDIVINEIMYNPADNSENKEYVELYNRGAVPVDLSGCYFDVGLTYTFPPGATLPANGYVVLAGDPATVQSTYGITGVIGPYTGKLENSGERLTLSDPSGLMLDTVRYNDKSPWPKTPDGAGPSLELVDPWQPNNEPANWRAHRPSQAAWQYVERTGNATSSVLYIYLLGAGECLIDDISIVPATGGQELVNNGGFENGNTGWAKTGNHSGSYRLTTGSHSGAACMQIVATDAGGSSSNSLNCTTQPLTTGQSYKLSFWCKYINGSNQLQSRLSQNGLLGTTTLIGGGFDTVGTPGQRNSVTGVELPPWVSDIVLSASSPLAGHIQEINALVYGASSVVLEYGLSLDFPTDHTTLPMLAQGGGWFSATIPPMGYITVVRYRLRITDGHGAVTYDPPADAEVVYYAYYVSEVVSDNLPRYRLYAKQSDLDYLTTDIWRDDAAPGTLVMDNNKVYPVTFRYRGGSSRIWPKKNYKVYFPDGFRPDGLNSMDMNGQFSDKLFLRELLCHRLYGQAGGPYCQCDPTVMYLNDGFWGIYIRVESVNHDYLVRNQRNPDGDLYKSYGSSLPLASYEDYAQTYTRQTNETQTYDDIKSFIETMKSLSGSSLKSYLDSHLDVTSFANYLAVTNLVMDHDHLHKNYFWYKDTPNLGKWEMLPWDKDLTMGRTFPGGGIHGILSDTITWDYPLDYGAATHDANSYNGMIDKFLSVPEYQAQYKQRMANLMATIFTTNNLFPMIDTLAEQIRPQVPRDREVWGSWGDETNRDVDTQVSYIKTFITNRRSFLSSRLPTPQATPTFTPSTPTATPSPTVSPTITLSQTPTQTRTLTPSATATRTPTSATPSPIPTHFPGDADGNRYVNGDDFRAVRNNFGAYTYTDGDADGNGFVNGNDFRAVRDNFGYAY